MRDGAIIFDNSLLRKLSSVFATPKLLCYNSGLAII